MEKEEISNVISTKCEYIDSIAENSATAIWYQFSTTIHSRLIFMKTWTQYWNKSSFYTII